MDNNYNNNDFNGNQGQYGNVPQQPYGNAPQQPYGYDQQGYGNVPQQPYGNMQQPSPYSAPQGYYGQQAPQKKSNTALIVALCLIIPIVVLLIGAAILIPAISGYTKKAEEARRQSLTKDVTEYSTEIDDDFGTEDVDDGYEYDIPEELTADSLTLPGELDQDSTGEIVAEFTDDIFKSAKWLEKHSDSYLVPNSDGTFTYYKSKDDLNNYYYIGHYDLYTGQAAYDYVTSNPDMANYGVTAEEMDGVFGRNEIYDMKNFVCLVLHNEQRIIDGENTITETVDTPYFGFYRVEGNGEESLDIANMNASEYYWFAKEQ